jgi:hypothetical protein
MHMLPRRTNEDELMDRVAILEKQHDRIEAEIVELKKQIAYMVEGIEYD